MLLLCDQDIWCDLSVKTTRDATLVLLSCDTKLIKETVFKVADRFRPVSPFNHFFQRKLVINSFILCPLAIRNDLFSVINWLGGALSVFLMFLRSRVKL